MKFKAISYWNKDRTPLNNPTNQAHGTLAFVTYPFEVNIERKTMSYKSGPDCVTHSSFDELIMVEQAPIAYGSEYIR